MTDRSRDQPRPPRPEPQRPRITRATILGVVLAGGRSRRMGTEKALITLAGRSLAAHAVERLRPQVGHLVFNANGDPTRFRTLGIPIVADTVAEDPGPLAGLLAAMDFARSTLPDVSHVAMVPVDTPFFPVDLAARLTEALSDAAGADVAYAATPLYRQPVFALAAMRLLDKLQRDIVTGSATRVGDWLSAQAHAEARFDDEDAFFNINTPEDLAVAEGRLRR